MKNTVADRQIVAATTNSHKIKEIGEIVRSLGMDIISRDEAGVPPVEIEETGTTFEENSFIKAYEIMKLSGQVTIADDSGLEVKCLEGAPGIYSARFGGFEGLWPEKSTTSSPSTASSAATTSSVSTTGSTAGASSVSATTSSVSTTASTAGASDVSTTASSPSTIGAGSTAKDISVSTACASSAAESAIADCSDRTNNEKLVNLIKEFPADKRRARYVCVITMAWPDGKKIVARGEVYGHLITEERGNRGFGYDPLFIPDGYDETFGQMNPDKKNSISHRAVALKILKEKLDETC